MDAAATSLPMITLSTHAYLFEDGVFSSMDHLEERPSQDL